MPSSCQIRADFIPSEEEVEEYLVHKQLFWERMKHLGRVFKPEDFVGFISTGIAVRDGPRLNPVFTPTQEGCLT